MVDVTANNEERDMVDTNNIQPADVIAPWPDAQHFDVPGATRDMTAYNARLTHSMADKLFFLERLPPDVTVFADFGCADGYLLRSIYTDKREVVPSGYQTILIGYDKDPAQIDRCMARPFAGYGNFEFTNRLDMFMARIQRHQRAGKKVCLVLSSVVHEVMSEPGADFQRFWLTIRDIGADWIAIRDMCVEEAAHHHYLTDDEWLVLCSAGDTLVTAMKQHTKSGTAPTRAAWLEGLLKAQYPDNLEAELKESYFPLTSEQWHNWTTVGSGYKLRHFDHAPVPHIQRKWHTAYGIWVPDATHIKLLLQKV